MKFSCRGRPSYDMLGDVKQEPGFMLRRWCSRARAGTASTTGAPTRTWCDATSCRPKCIDASGEATLSVFDDQALPAPAPSTPLEPVLAQTSCGGTPLQLKRCMPFYGTHL